MSENENSQKLDTEELDDKEIENSMNEVIQLDKDAKKIVLGFTTAAAGTGAIPIPFADMPILIGEQVAMMSSICALYKIKVKKEGLKMLAVQVIGAGGTALLGKTIATNVIKMIPGAGSVAGGVISATTAGALTLSLGMAFIKICDEVKLGKLSEDEMFSKQTAKKMKKYFSEEMKKNQEDENGE
ncbi:YcjF family protein [Butyrivibrio sp. NC2007]|uniref:YcjF family protein n=1 Tax=Butyrivibrio sp. NC2007 TaxID=1280683 RepID=UPI0003B38A43|nr:DUF697 domain-containing protein [Butyrivibrio sp. NC2007]